MTRVGVLLSGNTNGAGRRYIAAALVVACVALSLPARASEDAKAEARRQFQEGEQHFAARRFQEALRAYEAGYAAEPRPGFLLNIGQCHRRLGDLDRAKVAFQKFLLVAPDSPRRAEIEGLVAEIDQVVSAIPEKEAAPAPAPSPLITAPAPAPERQSQARSRWWVWAGVAAAIAGGTLAAFAVVPARTPSPVGEGDLGTLRR